MLTARFPLGQALSPVQVGTWAMPALTRQSWQTCGTAGSVEFWASATAERVTKAITEEVEKCIFADVRVCVCEAEVVWSWFDSVLVSDKRV